jgi:chromosome segregation ATPase
LQVLTRTTTQQLSAAQAESSRLRAALQAAENQLAAKDARIVALHADLHLLDAQRDDLKLAVSDASGAAAHAVGNSAALTARVRALQAQLRDRDEAESLLKEQLVDVKVRGQHTGAVTNCRLRLMDMRS